MAGHVRVDLDPAASEHEGDASRMQVKSIAARGAAIDRVAADGKPGVGAVEAQLVRTAGGGPQREPGDTPRPPEQWKIPFEEDLLMPGEEALIIGRIKVDQHRWKSNQLRKSGKVNGEGGFPDPAFLGDDGDGFHRPTLTGCLIAGNSECLFAGLP